MWRGSPRVSSKRIRRRRRPNVLAAIHAAANIASTPGWGGIGNAGAGSPNELLHWGSFNDGQIDDDPHMTTVEAVRYDFQTAGELVTLRDGEAWRSRRARQRYRRPRPSLTNMPGWRRAWA